MFLSESFLKLYEDLSRLNEAQDILTTESLKDLGFKINETDKFAELSENGHTLAIKLTGDDSGALIKIDNSCLFTYKSLTEAKTSDIAQPHMASIRNMVGIRNAVDEFKKLARMVQLSPEDFKNSSYLAFLFILAVFGEGKFDYFGFVLKGELADRLTNHFTNNIAKDLQDKLYNKGLPFEYLKDCVKIQKAEFIPTAESFPWILAVTVVITNNKTNKQITKTFNLKVSSGKAIADIFLNQSGKLSETIDYDTIVEELFKSGFLPRATGK